MKKRLLSLLLTVCMLVTLFTALSTSASAADDKVSGYLTSYTMVAGDTIYSVCKDKGIDFSLNYQKILKINNITNPNWLYPGTHLWLPTATASTGSTYYTLLSHILAAGETPASLCQSYGIDYTANSVLLAALNSNLTSYIVGQTIVLPLKVTPPGTVTPTPSATAAPSASANPSGSPAVTPTPAPGVAGDKLAYYLAQHVLKYGETVSGVCAELGVDFGKYSDTIMRLNKITNYNYLIAGQTLLIPTTTVPTGSYYRVMAHTVAAGDTVYNLCGTYGINFGTYSTLIQNLNNTTNLASFYVGQTLYMPSYVAGAVVNPSGKTPSGTGSGTITGTITAMDGNSITVGSTSFIIRGAGLTGTPVVGATATVTYTTADGVYHASNVVVSTGGSAAPSGSGVITGVVSEVTDKSITVNGTHFVINGTGLANIAVVGATVTVTYTISGTTFTATKIVLNTAPGVEGDTLSYYLAAHVLKYGETVSGICAELGVNFMEVQDQITKLSGVDNINYIMPGKTLLIPMKTVPTGPYYKVMAHTVAAGDTVYNLCSSYGLNYFTYSNLIQNLNKTNNLTSFYVGQTLYMPIYVAGSINPAPTAVPTAAPTPAPGHTPTPAPSGSPASSMSGKVTAMDTGSITVETTKFITSGITVPATVTIGTTVTVTYTASGTTFTATKVTVGVNPTAAPINVPEADTLSYYLVPHALKYGETVSGVCADLGVNYMDVLDQIQTYSGIANINWLNPGTVLMIPLKTVPNTSYYKVMSHTIVAGDTLYDLIIKYGMNYTNNLAFVQRLNSSYVLNTFSVGQTVYLPLYVAK